MPGRLDRHVEVAEPDEEARREILEIHTRDRPIANDVELDELVDRTEGYVGADIEAVCREAAQLAVREHVHSTRSGDTADVEGIELAMEHFEEALNEIDSSATGDRRRFGQAAEVSQGVT